MSETLLTSKDVVEADRNGEYGLAISLRVDQVETTPDHDWWAQILHCTDARGVHLKITVFDDCELAEFDFDEGVWYEFDDVNADVYNGTIGIEAKWERQVEQLPRQPEAPAEELDGVVRRLGDVERVGALDIETITTVSERELEPPNPDHQEILCTGVGYRENGNEEVETDVVFREDATHRAELEAIEAVVDWLDTRNVEVLVTFGGAWFDLPVLTGRAERAAAAVDEPERGEWVRTTLESFAHADLSATKNRAIGEGSLETMASHVGSAPPETLWTDYETGVSPRNWRGDQWQVMLEEEREPPSDDLDDPVVFNSDVPYLGEAWLDAREVGEESRERALYDCLYTYTERDIQPLFDVADADIAAGQPAFQMEY